MELLYKFQETEMKRINRQHDRKASIFVCWCMLWPCAKWDHFAWRPSSSEWLHVRELALKCMCELTPRVPAYVYSLCCSLLMENSRLRASLHTRTPRSQQHRQSESTLKLSGRGCFSFFFRRCFGSVSSVLVHTCVAKLSAKCCLTVWNLNGL